MTEPFCCRCKEDFPIAVQQTRVRWTMGQLYPLAKVPKKIRDQFKDWLDHPEGHYLCGNCYFDLTDE